MTGQRVHLTRSADRGAFSVLVCRACCCGTERKHPDVDHDAQRLALLAAAHAGGGSCRVVDCLGECHASNVVVVRHRRGRPADWFGHVLEPAQTEALAGWLRSGAAGEPPAEVAALRVARRSTAVR